MIKLITAKGTAVAFQNFIKLTVVKSSTARFTAVSVDTKGEANYVLVVSGLNAAHNTADATIRVHSFASFIIKFKNNTGMVDFVLKEDPDHIHSINEDFGDCEYCNLYPKQCTI